MQLMDTRRIVSCIMVTRPARDRLVRGAILDFMRQTHHDRELVVGYQLDRPAGDEFYCMSAAMAPLFCLRDWIARRDTHGAALGRYRFTVFFQGEGRMPTLGEMRNALLAEAVGEYWCQWDDDDRHHRRRVEEQLAVLEGHPDAVACYLTDQLYCHMKEHVYHWISRRGEPGGGSRCFLPGTMLCRRRDDVRYAHRRRGEDVTFFRALERVGYVVGLSDRPWLHIMQWHGGNTTPMSTYRSDVRDRSAGLALLRARRDAIAAGLRDFPADVPRVTIAARGGEALDVELSE